MQNAEKNTHQFDIDMVIDYVSKRVQSLVSQINDNRLTDNFNANCLMAGDDGGFSLIGSLLMDTFLFGAIAETADVALESAGLIDGPFFATEFNHAAVVAIDAYTMVQEDSNIRSFRLNGVRAYYPKGRKKGKAIDPKIAARFNRAANQNFSTPYAREAELAALIEMLKSLDALAKAKLETITVEKGDSIANVVKRLHNSHKKDGGFDIMFGGLRRAI